MQSKTDAVNYLLDVLGSPPVTTLDVLHPDVATSLTKLQDSSLSVQTTSMWYNREFSIVLTPNEAGEIDVPVDCIKVLAIYDTKAIQRGEKLYDRHNNTYQFTQPVTVDMVRHLEWEYLPVSVQLAIKYRAAMQVATIDLEDAQKGSDQEKLYNQAFAWLKAEDLQINRHNMLQTPQAKTHLSMTRRGRRGSYNPIYPGGGM